MMAVIYLDSMLQETFFMKIINSIMTVIGWTVTVGALLAALGFGYMHLHYGPIDIRVPTHSR